MTALPNKNSEQSKKDQVEEMFNQHFSKVRFAESFAFGKY
jgi:hypothetical protein